LAETWQMDGRLGKSDPDKFSPEMLQWFWLAAWLKSLKAGLLLSGIWCIILVLPMQFSLNVPQTRKFVSAWIVRKPFLRLLLTGSMSPKAGKITVLGTSMRATYIAGYIYELSDSIYPCQGGVYGCFVFGYTVLELLSLKLIIFLYQTHMPAIQWCWLYAVHLLALIDQWKGQIFVCEICWIIYAVCKSAVYYIICITLSCERSRTLLLS